MDRSKLKVDVSKDNFGSRLKALREAHGYKSPGAFAKACGVSKQTAYNWEVRTDPPLRSALRKIANAVGMNLAETAFELGLKDIPPRSNVDDEPPYDPRKQAARDACTAYLHEYLRRATAIPGAAERALIQLKLHLPMSELDQLQRERDIDEMLRAADDAALAQRAADERIQRAKAVGHGM